MRGKLMDLKEKIGTYLDQIKRIRGVENAVLTQRDGNPIQSSGVWFSKDEIFNVSSATSAIYNVGIHIHPHDLKYILIEGRKAKILIAPLQGSIRHSLNRIINKQGIFESDNEYFIAITAQPDTNLGGIFLQTRECLKQIKTTLITSGESFKPPLIQFNEEQVQKILNSFNVKENEENQLEIKPFSLNLSDNLLFELRKVLNNFSIAIPDLHYAHVTIEGGFIASKILKQNPIQTKNNIDKLSAMSYSLFQTANRCAWLLKKMNADTILLDCEYTFHFIYGMDRAIFSAEIGKFKQKLGLIRLIIPQFSRKINNILKEASQIKIPKTFDIKSILGELIIK